MAARVKGLGHVGIYVQDLDAMKAFYGDFMGMTLTKCNDMMAFYSTDPEAVDHEIALMKGRPSAEDPHLIQQISLRVDTLDDVRDFRRRIIEKGYKIREIVTHASAIGCYFSDPEGNNTEVFWLTGLTSWATVGVPIDIERPDEEVMADVRAVWEKVRHIPMGQKPDAETSKAIRELMGRPAPVEAS
ncbi:MAG TPA: VOC family protein [Dehalococcoidia bacterium]|nr:VOC family protein [Dehalococcoidia bacterium]